MINNATVLLVDDEENDLFLMERSIGRTTALIKVQSTKDGEEAVEYLSGQNKFSNRTLYPLPQLILLDIKMPRRNGFEVLEWLQNESALTHIPVVMVTSSKVKSDVAKARGLGARAYLVKPVALDELQKLFTDTDAFLAAHVS